MAEIKPIKINNLGIYGVIRRAEVHDTLIPDGAVTDALNVNFDRKGAIQLRPGITALSTTATTTGTIGVAGTCWGLFGAVLSSPSTYMPLAVFTRSGSSSIHMYQSGSWAVSLDGDTGSLKTRFTTFNNYVFRVNGTDNMKVWANGGTWIVTGGMMNPDDMANFDTKFIETYKSRVYTAGYSAYPNRLYFSSVISSTGLIDWTPTTDYVDIWTDGEEISALKRFSTELLVFKPNYIYRFKTSGVDPDPLVRVGTRSQESVIEGKKGIYFHHETGFYRYSGSYPEDISRPISDIIEAIPYSAYDDIYTWKDADHVYFAVGDLTVDGEFLTNIVCRYTESSDVWTVYSYGKEIIHAAQYNDNSTITNIVGSNDGHVYTINSGNTDAGTVIGYSATTKWYDFGIIELDKLIKKIIATCEKAQGSKIYFQVDDNDYWTELGQLKEYMTEFDQLAIKFHRIRFRIRGISDKEAFIFEGLTITDYSLS